MKSHPKRMEMKKKKIPPGPEASKEAFGDAQMGFSDAALSKFSQDDFFLLHFSLFGFSDPAEKRREDASRPPNLD